MAEEKLGLQAALQLVGDDRLRLLGVTGEQLPLLPAAELDEPAEKIDPPADGARGPGRPRGARNRRTEEWVDYLLSRYRSPLIALAETYSRPVAVLAAELNTSRLEAFKLQISAAKELAPYLHQRQPLGIQVDSRGVVQLVIAGDAPAEAVQAADGLVLEAQIINEENQSLSDTSPAELDSDELDSRAKPLDEGGNSP